MPLCRLAGALVLALFLLSGFTPLPNLASAWLEIPTTVGPAGAIVVLGAGSGRNGDRLSNASLRRALRGILLFRTGLAPLLVFSGDPAEVQARVELARTLGIPPEHLLADGGAYTTRDEAARLPALLAERGVDRILLVTDSQHMIRARPLFERSGFAVLAASADDYSTTATRPEERLRLARVIWGEALARLYYRLAGYL